MFETMVVICLKSSHYDFFLITFRNAVKGIFIYSNLLTVKKCI